MPISTGSADPPLVPAAVLICAVTLVSSLVVGSGLLVSVFARRWDLGILHPISTLALLPLVLSLI